MKSNKKSLKNSVNLSKKIRRLEKENKELKKEINNLRINLKNEIEGLDQDLSSQLDNIKQAVKSLGYNFEENDRARNREEELERLER